MPTAETELLAAQRRLARAVQQLDAERALRLKAERQLRMVRGHLARRNAELAAMRAASAGAPAASR